MRGISGLILALAAGAVGAICNWIYLANKSPDFEKVSFIGIREGVTLAQGDRLKIEHLEEIQIPRARVGNLEKYAFLYADRRSVEGMTVSRIQVGPALLLQQDLRPPPPELKFASPHVLMWVSIDTGNFVPALITPGEDMVSFVVPSERGPAPTPAGKSILSGSTGDAEKDETPPAPVRLPPAGESPEIIGPFRVLALGNRVASSEVTRAAKISVSQENVLGIEAKLQDGKLEPKAARLWALRSSGFQRLGVLRHAREGAKDQSN